MLIHALLSQAKRSLDLDNFFHHRIRGGRAAIIEDVVVLKSMRGRGIGKRIMKELIDCARRKKCFKINLETSNAGKQMYETLNLSKVV